MIEYILYDAYVEIKNTLKEEKINLYYSIIQMFYTSLINYSAEKNYETRQIFDGGISYCCFITPTKILLTSMNIILIQNFELSKNTLEDILIGRQLL